MNNSSVYLLIIWSKGLSFKDHILKDLKEQFNILNFFKVKWNDANFLDNLKRFYSHSLKSKTEIELEEILKAKIEHCGNEEFLAIVFQDLTPIIESRETSDGISLVNINVFNKKAEYRKLLGGGHKIHTSDNAFETNKDLTILFGYNTNDFLKKHKPSTQEKYYNENVLGVPEWKDISELFYTLNNSIDYVVLRNFECFPDDYNLEGHGDIDLLVEDLNYVKYLTGAKAAYTLIKHRVYCHIKINDEEIPFDFRFLGDDYYCKKWQLEILKKRVLYQNSFYKPDTINYFYSLLYHAYVHKKEVSIDYKTRLKTIGANIEVNYSQEEAMNLLSNFLIKHDYSFSLPNDLTVFYNKRNIDKTKIESITNNYGRLVSSNINRTLSESYLTEVYENENSFFKVSSHPISYNENKFLTILENKVYFPKSINIFNKNNYDVVEIEKIKGQSLNIINDVSGFWRFKNISYYLYHSIEVLIILVENNIIHRDIRPENIFVIKKGRKYLPRLIDFGWSINCDDKNVLNPIGLGNKHKPKNGFSDMYSMGSSLNAYLGKFDCYRDYIDSLMSLNKLSYNNKEKLLKELNIIKHKIKNEPLSISFNDRKQMLIKKVKANIGAKNISKIVAIIRK